MLQKAKFEGVPTRRSLFLSSPFGVWVTVWVSLGPNRDPNSNSSKKCKKFPVL